jgi:methionyl-tRNA formyltransferase
MRIAVAGYGLLGAGLTRALLDSNHEIVAIVQNGRKTRGIERAVAVAVSHVFATEGSMLGLARPERLPVVWLNRMDENELAPLRALAPDLLLVGGFGIILKRPILDLPKIGCVNAHSSLLPKHRAPIRSRRCCSRTSRRAA